MTSRSKSRSRSLVALFMWLATGLCVALIIIDIVMLVHGRIGGGQGPLLIAIVLVEILAAAAFGIGAVAMTQSAGGQNGND